jgi:hypothetical protein
VSRRKHPSRLGQADKTIRSIPINFLLGCSDSALANFELARLGSAADLRSELHAAQAGVIAWFRTIDRATLRQVLENPVDPIAWAKEEIRRRHTSQEEEEGGLIPLTSLPPGAAHLASSMRYQERNIAKGKCSVCPKPLARNSVRYCEKHLTAVRLRMNPSKGKPGSIGWLYGETEETSHGRQPASLAALEMAREQKTRALLAEMGISPERAAVTLNAVKEALLKCMPDSKASALSAEALFQAATVPSVQTGRKALRELLSAGSIERIGGGFSGNPFRYFKRSRASEDRAARNRGVLGDGRRTDI